MHRAGWTNGALAGALGAAVALSSVAIAAPVYKGFNSWDSFQGNVNETQFMAISTAMATLLLPAGYDTVTVDEFWYPDDAGDASSIDAYGRAIVNTTKWPSAVGGTGFKSVSDRVHAMGLKFGIHVMHGVPVGAKGSDATVLGTNVKVWDLVTEAQDRCPWNTNWYRIDMNKDGAQEYLNSVYSLYASWGVDFIKNDCVFGANFDDLTLSNIQGARKAMDTAGRPMVYSLSPGFSTQQSPTDAAAESAKVSSIVNLYRITSDWHGWDGADKEQGWSLHFSMANATRALRDYPSFDHTTSFPDMDMLNPFQDPESFRMQQTLWCMVRSPLIYGGDPRTLSPTHPHVEIMSNADVLHVADASSNAMPVWYNTSSSAWVADAENGDKYVAMFKFAGSPQDVTVTFAQMQLTTNTATVTDLWTGQSKSYVSHAVTSATLAPCHTDGSNSPTPCTALYRVSPEN